MTPHEAPGFAVAAVENGRVTTHPRPPAPLGRFWRAAPVALVAVLAVVGGVLDELIRSGAMGGTDDVTAAPALSGWTTGALVLAQAALLWWRDRSPVAVLVVVTALDLVLLEVSGGGLSVGSIAVMFAVYTVCRRVPGARGYAWATALGAASTVVAWAAMTGTPDVPAGWELPFAVVRSVLGYLVPTLIAEVAASRSRTLLALRERAELAERERERGALDAVQRERSLMARELHDIAAHHLTGIIVGSQAAGALVGPDPERAREYIRTVARDAQLTLANLRQTVGLLRSGDSGELAPVPAIAQIDELVDEVRATGMRVELERSGGATPLGPLAETAAYRMVQESLANARQHAPAAACTVRVDYTRGGARISVSNEAPVAPALPTGRGGHGLVGMRERATLVGARLRTGPTGDGGWRNELELPPPDPRPDDPRPDDEGDHA
jgi:signal transduction histidine kinase